MTKKLKPYPGVICADCGEKYGKHRGEFSTWYSVDCEVCGETKTGIETRDFGYPKLPGFEGDDDIAVDAFFALLKGK